ncbi:MAG TPA: hypothetical protein VGN23_02620 [Verrucomicrobiae bacterium]|jgi:hypothetical protein
MKPNRAAQNTGAFSNTDALVALVLGVGLAFCGLIYLENVNIQRHRPLRIECVNNLQEMGLAYLVWAKDHNEKFPMEIPVAEGGTKGLVEGRNAWVNFYVMSNALATTFDLYCPADNQHFMTTNFASLNSANVSYFVGAGC